MAFWGNISKFKIIRFQNLSGSDIRKSNRRENTFRSCDGECQPEHLNCSILQFRPSPLSFRPTNHYVAAYICIRGNEYAAYLWWAKYWRALSDRAETVGLLTLLCCGGLAWLSSFLEAYPKQTWSNNSLIGWRLIMKLSLSSRSLSGEGTKWEEGGRQWGERIQQPLWASQTGREDDEFGRGIKRVLIQLGKIYGQMRIWQWTL